MQEITLILYSGSMAGDFLARIKQSPILCDGAMGTLLYAKGVFINRCYDELNLSQPDLIRGIHHEYLQAGAEIVETNTFGANSFRLARHSLADKVADINRAGADALDKSLPGTTSTATGKDLDPTVKASQNNNDAAAQNKVDASNQATDQKNKQLDTCTNHGTQACSK